MSNAEAVGDAFGVSVVIVIVIVVAIAAVVYAVIKKKKNYDTKGVPKRVDNPEEHEGTTDKAEAAAEEVAAEAETTAEEDKPEAGE